MVPSARGRLDPQVSPRGRRWLFVAAAMLGLIGLLAALAWTMSATWADAGIRLGFHGWMALTIALSGVTAVGGGLMFLAFYSARSGWDDIDRDEL